VARIETSAAEVQPPVVDRDRLGSHRLAAGHVDDAVHAGVGRHVALVLVDDPDDLAPTVVA
jgi:hypothetical protein